MKLNRSIWIIIVLIVFGLQQGTYWLMHPIFENQENLINFLTAYSPNFFAGIIMPFLGLAIRDFIYNRLGKSDSTERDKSSLTIRKLVFVGFIVFEILQDFILETLFDYSSLIMSAAGVLIAEIIYRFLHGFNTQKQNKKLP